MKAVEDYKVMLFDVGRVLGVFSAYANAYKSYMEQPTKEAERTMSHCADIVKQWSVDDVGQRQRKIMSYDPGHRIEAELTNDDPDRAKLRLRLDWTYWRLGDDGCFAQWDEDYFKLPTKDGKGNKNMYDAIVALQGEKYAFDVMCKLESIAMWVNLKVADVGAMLERLCKMAEYKPQEQQKQAQEATNAISLAVMPNEPQQAVQGQQIGNIEPQQEKTLKDLLPEQLRGADAVAIFQRAIDDGLIRKTGTGFLWQGAKQLLAYFAERMSSKFNLSTKIDKDGNKTTNWKIFENLFCVEKLKGAKQNWMRLNLSFSPTGFEKVDALF